MTQVLVLDPGFQPLNEISLKKAVRLMMRERVVDGAPTRIVEPVYLPTRPIEEQSFIVRMAKSFILVPKIMRIIHVVRRAMRTSVPLTKKNVMIRDRFTCTYCGAKSNLNIDHVTPICRGGRQTWENMVTSCVSCNQRKGDKTPREAGMSLRHSPHQPTITEHMHSRIDMLGVTDLLKELFGA